jgi:glucose-6-phosphate 1-epimerase
MQDRLTRVAVTTSHADAEIFLQGATVTRFVPKGRGPVLYLSPNSNFEPGKAIRGGVPLIFPWFGPHPTDKSAPQHGFVRAAPWTIAHVDAGPDTVLVRLAFDASERAPGVRLEYEVRVSAELDLALTVVNDSLQPFRYEDGLHTYLQVADVRTTELRGLAGRTYIDKMDGMKRKVQDPDPLVLTGPTDRVYLDAPGPVTVKDGDRTITVEKEGSQATVVWNPWDSGAAKLKDLGASEWVRMVCVEAANAADNAVELPPGTSHTTRTRIRCT